MNHSPAGQGLHAPGRDLAVPGRSSHPATDSMLVLVGGFSFIGLAVWAKVDPQEAAGTSLALVAGLKATLWLPAGVAVAWSKVRRFLHA